MIVEKRVVVRADAAIAKRLLGQNEFAEMEKVTYRKEWRLCDVPGTQAYVRCSKDLQGLIEQDSVKTVVLNCALLSPTEQEVDQRKRLRVDILPNSLPEEFLSLVKAEFAPCDEWTKGLTRLVAVDGQKGSEILHKLKELVKEAENNE